MVLCNVRRSDAKDCSYGDRKNYTDVLEKVKLHDKSALYLPRHSSFMIMHTFADWGNTGHNMAESLGITTVSTTKAHGGNRDEGKGVGMIP